MGSKRLNKVECFREMLEESCLRLTDRNHLANLIPFILEEEQKNIKQDLEGENASVVFDGTSCDEAMAIGLQYVTEV